MTIRYAVLASFSALLLASCSALPEPAPTPVVAGAVSSAEPRATAAGEEMLAMGGSATDAALATLVALTVVEPQSSGIGGGGFLVRTDAQGHVVTYDGREMAPAAANESWFLGEDGEPLGYREVVPGGRSVGVPGNIAMMKLAHDAHGTVAWATLFQPAIRLARDGFAMSQRLHDTIEGTRGTSDLTSDARAMYLGADGKALPVGTIVRNPALADLLERVAAQGPSAFYRGQNAQAIADAVANAPIAPAPMTAVDVERYVAKQRPAVCSAYRDYRICSMGPPSSGATTVLGILKALERFDMASLGPDNPQSWHLFAEATRLAFADRGAYLGDGDYVDVPVAGLVDDDYLTERSLLIDPDRAMDEVPVGTPEGAPKMAAGQEPNEFGTSHFAAVDSDGNMVSLTSTIEAVFGSGLIANGYYLNNELTDFSFAPKAEDGTPAANRVQSGKRPRSSMSPSIVFDPEGRPVLAVGAAGGPTIITQTAKNIMAFIDWKMTAEQALAVPNLYAPGAVTMVEEREGIEALVAYLEARGHPNVRVGLGGKANAVEWNEGRWRGVMDPRTTN